MSRRGVIRQLLVVGRASGRGAGGDGWIHRLGLAAATAAVLVSVWAFVVTAAVFSARDERMQARAPVFATRGEPSIGRWYQRADSVDGRQFSVVFLSPEVPGARPPPGLSRWPRPGEAFLSPALLSQPDAAELRQRYGRFAGAIGMPGLADPGELLAYVGPRNGAALSAPHLRTELAGFGRSDAFEVLASQDTDRRPNDVYWMLACLVAMPAAVFAVVAARTGAERRDRRVALLEAIGAPRRARAWLLVGESASAITMGAGLAVAVLSIVMLRDEKLPGPGYLIAASDVAHLRPMLPVVGVAVAVAMLALVVAMHSRSRPRVTTRPRTHGAPLPRWRLLLFGFGVVLCTFGAAIGSHLGGRIFLVGLVATLTGAPLVAGQASAMLGTLVSRYGARAGRPAAIIGGRWLAARPATIARLCSAVVIGLGLLLQIQVLTTSYTAVERAATGVYDSVGSDLMTVHVRGVDQGSLSRFEGQLAAGQRVLVVNQPADGPAVITAPCAVLRAVDRLARCPKGVAPLREVYGDTSARAQALSSWTGLVDRQSLIKAAPAVVTPATVGLLVFNPDGASGVSRVKEAAYAHLPTPIVLTPGQPTIEGARSHARLAPWVLLFGGVGMFVLALLAAVSSATTFAQQATGLGPLAGFSSTRRLFIGVAGWNVTLPIALAAVLGAGVAVWLGALSLHLSGGDGHASVSMALVLDTVLLLWVSAAGAGLLCAKVALRAARTWVPHGD